MNPNQSRARGPTKAPMRGGSGRPSRPPMGGRGAQQGYQQQPRGSRRGRGGGVSRGGYAQQQTYNRQGAYGGYQVESMRNFYFFPKFACGTLVALYVKRLSTESESPFLPISVSQVDPRPNVQS